MSNHQSKVTSISSEEYSHPHITALKETIKGLASSIPNKNDIKKVYEGKSEDLRSNKDNTHEESSTLGNITNPVSKHHSGSLLSDQPRSNVSTTAVRGGSDDLHNGINQLNNTNGHNSDLTGASSQVNRDNERLGHGAIGGGIAGATLGKEALRERHDQEPRVQNPRDTQFAHQSSYPQSGSDAAGTSIENIPHHDQTNNAPHDPSLVNRENHHDHALLDQSDRKTHTGRDIAGATATGLALGAGAHSHDHHNDKLQQSDVTPYKNGLANPNETVLPNTTTATPNVLNASHDSIDPANHHAPTEHLPSTVPASHPSRDGEMLTTHPEEHRGPMERTLSARSDSSTLSQKLLRDLHQHLDDDAPGANSTMLPTEQNSNLREPLSSGEHIGQNHNDRKVSGANVTDAALGAGARSLRNHSDNTPLNSSNFPQQLNSGSGLGNLSNGPNNLLPEHDIHNRSLNEVSNPEHLGRHSGNHVEATPAFDSFSNNENRVLGNDNGTLNTGNPLGHHLTGETNSFGNHNNHHGRELAGATATGAVLGEGTHALRDHHHRDISPLNSGHPHQHVSTDNSHNFKETSMLNNNNNTLNSTGSLSHPVDVTSNLGHHDNHHGRELAGAAATGAALGEGTHSLRNHHENSSLVSGNALPHIGTDNGLSNLGNGSNNLLQGHDVHNRGFNDVPNPGHVGNHVEAAPTFGSLHHNNGNNVLGNDKNDILNSGNPFSHHNDTLNAGNPLSHHLTGETNSFGNHDNHNGRELAGAAATGAVLGEGTHALRDHHHHDISPLNSGHPHQHVGTDSLRNHNNDNTLNSTGFNEVSNPEHLGRHSGNHVEVTPAFNSFSNNESGVLGNNNGTLNTGNPLGHHLTGETNSLGNHDNLYGREIAGTAGAVLGEGTHTLGEPHYNDNSPLKASNFPQQSGLPSSHNNLPGSVGEHTTVSSATHPSSIIPGDNTNTQRIPGSFP
ncbi:hypothetical protein K7432_004996 [Basidiobolus ranarum]|uniref:Uncharacterized protein n=1 Tax=Basidiobolus ranarum TaxID=34480 RepID=A0ABR2WXD6_9FUNG